MPPLPALAVWLVNYGVWHLPWVYDAALRHPHSLLHLEHALYFLTGLALWWPVVHGSLAAGAKAAYVFAAFLLASPIGLLMALVPDPIYDFYGEAPRLWGLSPILDQQIAGVSMAAAEAIVFFGAFAFFLRASSPSRTLRPDANVTSMGGLRSGSESLRNGRVGDGARGPIVAPAATAAPAMTAARVSANRAAQPRSAATAQTAARAKTASS